MFTKLYTGTGINIDIYCTYFMLHMLENNYVPIIVYSNDKAIATHANITCIL